MSEMMDFAYRILPPPLSALPAKYHAPLSLLLHSLSTGLIAHELATLAEMDDMRELAFFLGVTHDIHQKLVEDGLSSLKSAKKYIRDKFEELEKLDYYRYIDDALESDVCGKGIPIRGLPKELSLICHIGDMVQGRLEGIALLFWLRDQVKSLNPDLTVRFYSVMIPQVVARSYIMMQFYQKHIRETDHLALASPWGLYVITYEDQLPEVLEASWDELRINEELIPYIDIERAEASGETATINKINITRDEIKTKAWSRFARMFYEVSLLGNNGVLYPKLPTSIRDLFFNIEFSDIEFRDLGEADTHRCALCGLQHLAEDSIGTNLFGKIAGVSVTLEKWNRFLPAHAVVRGWKGQWENEIGLCPLCVLEAIGIRCSGFVGKLTGVLAVSISKPIPIELLNHLGRVLAGSSRINEPIVGKAEAERLILDYSSATIGTQEVSEPKTENLFRHRTSRGAEVNGVFLHIGKLVSWGIYPVKFLPSIDTSIVDRPVLTPYNFSLLDFPVTNKEYGHLIPWIGPLLATVGRMERSEALQYLDLSPEHAPLALLTLNKPKYKKGKGQAPILDLFSYDHVSETLSSIGVGI